jgi:hypothetical protein
MHYVAGIFLDFDNIYSSIHRQSPEAARDFAREPAGWLTPLQGMRGAETEDTIHNFVIRRCYMNPSGRVPGGEPYSHFRQSYVRDGWEVIDTPPLTNQGKTSADIHIVMDVLDAVTYYPHVSEYVIIAADADYTPLIIRLRKHMKKTVVYAAKSTSVAYRAACDSIIDEVEFLQIFAEEDASQSEPEQQPQLQLQPQPSQVALTAQSQITPTRVAATVHRYFKESGPNHEAHVSLIGHLLIKEFGRTIASDWMGYKTLSQLLKRLCNLDVRTEGTRAYARLTPQVALPPTSIATS